MVMFNIADL